MFGTFSSLQTVFRNDMYMHDMTALKRESVFMSALCTLHREWFPPAAAIINSRPPSVPNRATCGSKIELARCTETKNRPELGHPLSKRSLGNAPFLRALFLLKRVRFRYRSLINLFNYSFHSSQLQGAKSHSFCKTKACTFVPS